MLFSSHRLGQIDQVIARMLLIQPQKGAEKTRQTQATNVMRLSLVFSGIRCILQYFVLPFILPIVGIAADATIPILLTLNALAVISVFFSLRRMWQIEYQYRGYYLIMAIIVLLLLTTFTIMDVNVFFA
ncbi:MAG: hypothetical protein AAFX46_18800 [Cyanobacteria bacterium J06636_27]